MRVLILGGYGAFGGRLARLLSDEARLTLVIAGRSPEKAREFCAGLVGAATAEPAVFIRDLPAEPQLRPLEPDLVIDAMGPFQDYGAEPYAIVAAALAIGADYMDFADGTDFVRSIGRFDAEARANGRFVISGVSSFPVLTAAAVRRLASGLERVETIAAGIAPSPRAEPGASLVGAVASYAGKSATLIRDGVAATAPAMIDSRRYTIAPPGCLPLENRRFTLVEAPDLALLPAEWPGLRSVWTGVAPVPELLHRLLSGLAWIVRLRLLPSLAPFGPLFRWTIRYLRWGEHRSGMFVEVTGRDEAGEQVARSWHVIAEGDDGPMIPAMAIEALVRDCLDGRSPASGARAATGDVELADYERLFARHRIATGVHRTSEDGAPLYARLLGDSWDRLPGPLQLMHSPGTGMIAEGRATVERGHNPVAALVARLFGFPPAATGIPVRVTFSSDNGAECWERNFAGRRFCSLQREGTGRFNRLLAECFGPFTFGLALVLDGDRLRLVPRDWTAFGVPMPRFLMPGGEAFEAVEDGRFHFNVEIRLPFLGLMVRYRGWLEIRE